MNIAGFRKCVAVFCTISLLQLTFSAVVFAQNLNMPPAKKNSHPKMSSYLDKLEKEYKEGTSAAQMVAQGMNISSHDPDKVTVYLISEPGTSIDEDAIYDLGAQIIKQADNVTKAKVPIDMLTAIADTVKGVSFMKTPDKLIPLAVTTSEGVNLTGAYTYHNAGYDGSGVKVAVFDVGFIGLSNAILKNELPNTVVKVDCTEQPCDSNNPSIENNSNHGTAVAEIVYDMAPGATIYLIKVSDILDLRDAKDYAILNEIKIINLSGGWFNHNFYDGICYSDSSICTANDAYDHNILWVNAAGNYAQRHYEKTFDVSVGNEEIVLNHGNTISAGYAIEVYLTWNAWPTTDQDYDLYLYLYNDNGPDTLVDSSLNFQTGSQPPVEKIAYKVPTNGTYYLKINQDNASSNHRLELYSVNYDLSPSIALRSLMNPADSAKVLAVGAIDRLVWETGDQELFSSQGPTNDGRTKPDIMGPDNVSTDVYGSGFVGTSASSAHVSGAAALVLEKFPGTPVYDLRNFLREDNIYGFGRLELDINAVNPSGDTAATGGDGGGGGCFIATAAYGSYTAPSVRILRKMRDRFLIKSSIGKSFVNLYYKYSPPLANFVANHDNLKIFVRLSLLPIVGISWLALKLGPLFTLSLMALFVLGLIRLVSSRVFQRRSKTLARRTRLW